MEFLKNKWVIGTVVVVFALWLEIKHQTFSKLYNNVTGKTVA